ncbi:Rab GTPase [Planoprotostelium fungivorum]|uniref:Rab GTPase n=1 Tax=Planoprotostelium fungivorum TaxID=1890364 RepID=A0A2P6N548_9EUKA|nr:Rab GTPase [Planoprotostelium fungivorum]
MSEGESKSCCGGSSSKRGKRETVSVQGIASSRSVVDPSKGVKLCMLGEAAVGKFFTVRESLEIDLFDRKEFFDGEAPTIGAAFATKSHISNERTTKFEIWDTGQERFHSLAPMYYRGSFAALIVYDITQYYTYERAKTWITELRSNGTKAIIYLVGCKLDLSDRRAVDTDEVRQFAQQNDCLFAECSAKTGEGITPIFDKIAGQLWLQQQKQNTAPGSPNLPCLTLFTTLSWKRLPLCSSFYGNLYRFCTSRVQIKNRRDEASVAALHDAHPNLNQPDGPILHTDYLTNRGPYNSVWNASDSNNSRYYYNPCGVVKGYSSPFLILSTGSSPLINTDSSKCSSPDTAFIVYQCNSSISIMDPQFIYLGWSQQQGKCGPIFNFVVNCDLFISPYITSIDAQFTFAGGAITVYGDNLAGGVITLNGRECVGSTFNSNTSSLYCFINGPIASKSLLVGATNSNLTSMWTPFHTNVSSVYVLRTYTIVSKIPTVVNLTGLFAVVDPASVTMSNVTIDGVKASFAQTSPTYVTLNIPAGIGYGHSYMVYNFSYPLPYFSSATTPCNTDAVATVLLHCALCGPYSNNVSITIGGIPCVITSYVQEGSQYIHTTQCKYVPGTGGGRIISITAGNQTNYNAGIFSYNPPILSTISRPSTRGGRVDITGNNFGRKGSDISIGLSRDPNVYHNVVVYKNDTSLYFDVGAGSGINVINVVVNGTPQASYMYFLPPTILSLYSHDNPMGQIVLLNGDNMGTVMSDMSVDIQNVTCRNISLIQSHSQVLCLVDGGVNVTDNSFAQFYLAGQSSNNLRYPVQFSSDSQFCNLLLLTDQFDTDYLFGYSLMNSCGNLTIFYLNGDDVTPVPLSLADSLLEEIVTFRNIYDPLVSVNKMVNDIFADDQTLPSLDARAIDMSVSALNLFNYTSSDATPWHLSTTIDITAMTYDWYDNHSLTLSVPNALRSNLTSGYIQIERISRNIAPSIFTDRVNLTIVGDVYNAQIKNSGLSSASNVTEYTFLFDVSYDQIPIDYTVKCVRWDTNAKIWMNDVITVSSGASSVQCITYTSSYVSVAMFYEPKMYVDGLLQIQDLPISLNVSGYFGHVTSQTTATFDGTSVKILVVDARWMVVSILPGSGRNHQLEISAGLQSTTSVSYDYLPPYLIDKVVTMDTDGSTPIVLSCVGCSPSTTSNVVKIDGRVCTVGNVTGSVTDYVLNVTCIHVPGTGRGHQVSLTVNNQTNPQAGTLNYNAPEIVSSSSPNTTGGQVILRGKNFGRNSDLLRIVVDGIVYNGTILENDTVIYFAFPAGTGRHGLQLSVDGVSSNSSVSFMPPTITQLSSYSLNGTHYLFLLGYNFGDNNSLLRVLDGDVMCLNTSILVNQSQILCQIQRNSLEGNTTIVVDGIHSTTVIPPVALTIDGYCSILLNSSSSPLYMGQLILNGCKTSIGQYLSSDRVVPPQLVGIIVESLSETPAPQIFQSLNRLVVNTLRDNGQVDLQYSGSDLSLSVGHVTSQSVSLSIAGKGSSASVPQQVFTDMSIESGYVVFQKMSLSHFGSLFVTSNATNLVSDIHGLEVLDLDGKELSVQGVSQKIVLRMPLLSTTVPSESQVECVYWSGLNSLWVRDCDTVVDGDSILCSCSHLTNFSVGIFPKKAEDASSVPQSNRSIAIPIVAACAAAFVLLSLVLVFVALRKRSLMRKSRMNVELEFYNSASSFNRDDVVLIEKVHVGTGSTVYSALINGTAEVAVKRFNKGGMHEASLLQYMGVYKDVDGCLCMISEMVTGGTLSHALRKSKFEIHVIWSMAGQIASAMSYLDSNGIVHGDLTCDNILIKSDRKGTYQIKLCDFGMAREMMSSPSKVQNPHKESVRWSAPEVLRSHQYSTKSDVWAFGVVVWEMIHAGEVPYQSLTNSEVVTSVGLGRRLEVTEKVPDHVNKLLQMCWQTQPKDRPTFHNVTESIEEFLSDEEESGEEGEGEKTEEYGGERREEAQEYGGESEEYGGEAQQIMAYDVNENETADSPLLSSGKTTPRMKTPRLAMGGSPRLPSSIMEYDPYA